ncbi:hypothetical protein C8P63_10239 [Melghirimyces profundicolus]|uniref:Uncharacterized protein n=1 Tax=Melghirimyces profundicolus TaxID=1242148 RepID=A0A2T6C8E0_9BACL|nr:hypothetical protein C8P63_10239 [Melghirimyces profundicolus]
MNRFFFGTAEFLGMQTIPGVLDDLFRLLQRQAKLPRQLFRQVAGHRNSPSFPEAILYDC